MITENRSAWRHLPAWLLAVTLSACGSSATNTPTTPPAEVPPITVWKSPSCGCCGKWVEHLKEAGFDVEVIDENAMAPLKNHLGVPPDLASCHTAQIAGYLIEGHVPAGDLHRLLRERPKLKGLAVPGMPIGSPGMEMGNRIDPYEVVAYLSDGQRWVYSRHSTPPDQTP